MGKVIPLGGITLLDIPADRVLEAAMGKLDKVVIMGWSEDEEFYCASSVADGGDVLWLVELLKKELMESAELET